MWLRKLDLYINYLGSSDIYYFVFFGIEFRKKLLFFGFNSEKVVFKTIEYFFYLIKNSNHEKVKELVFRTNMELNSRFACFFYKKLTFLINI